MRNSFLPGWLPVEHSGIRTTLRQHEYPAGAAVADAGHRPALLSVPARCRQRIAELPIKLKASFVMHNTEASKKL